MKIVRKEDFPEIIRVYNQEGRNAAYGYIRSQYSIKNPYFIMTRIRKSPEYSYDPETDHYNKEKQGMGKESVFMSLEELCAPVIPQHIRHGELQAGSRPEAMERLVRELISDRLLELGRYIMMDPSSRTILIDQAAMMADGYKVVTH